MSTAKPNFYRSVKHREGAFPERFAKVGCHGDKTTEGTVDQKVHAGFLSIDFLNKGFNSIVIALVQYTRFNATRSSIFSCFFGESVEGFAIAGRCVDFAAFLASKSQGNSPTQSPRRAGYDANFAHFFLLGFMSMAMYKKSNFFRLPARFDQTFDQYIGKS